MSRQLQWEQRALSEKLRRPDPAHNAPMTTKQGKYLVALCHRHGRDFDPRLTARQAAELIDELVSDDVTFAMKGNTVPRFLALEAACPACHARRLQPCVGRQGPRTHLHAERYAAIQQ